MKFKVRFFSLFILSFFYFNVEYCGIGVGKLLYIKDELCFFDLRNISFLSLDGVFVLLLIWSDDGYLSVGIFIFGSGFLGIENIKFFFFFVVSFIFNVVGWKCCNGILKIFICEVCGKVFNVYYNLIWYMLVYIGVCLFKCKICGKGFR